MFTVRQQVLDIVRPFTAEMPILADPGYEGAGQGVFTPVKQPGNGRELDADTFSTSAPAASGASRKPRPHPRTFRMFSYISNTT
jgi:hypothetical protein